MQKWLILVEVNCTDPDRAEELHDWYEKTHIPDLLQLPGIVRVTRYENVTPGDVRGRPPPRSRKTRPGRRRRDAARSCCRSSQEPSIDSFQRTRDGLEWRVSFSSTS